MMGISLPQYSRKTWIVIIVVALVLLSFASVGVKSRFIKHKIAQGRAAGLNFPVEIEHPRKGPIVSVIRLVGNLQADEVVVLKPEISGKVVSLGFKEGQFVKAGAVLIELDPSIYKAQLAQAQASAKLSQQNFDRAVELKSKNVGSASAVDDAQAQLSNDKASVDLAQANLNKSTIVAPFDGRVGLRNVTVGDYVQPGDSLVTIVNDNPMKVDFHVPENVSSQVSAGQKVNVTVDGFPHEVFKGEVYAVDSVLDPEGRSLLVRAKVPNPSEKLRAGLFAQVNLILGEKLDALLLTEGALIPSADTFFVYVVDKDNKVVRKTVETGLREQGSVEIVSGLTEADQVVKSGQFKLYEGATVEVLPAHQQK